MGINLLGCADGNLDKLCVNILQTIQLTKEGDSLSCAKLVVLCNAPDDNHFMAGAFHGVSEADAIINMGVSSPGSSEACSGTGKWCRI